LIEGKEMARRPSGSLIKKAKTVTRVTRSETYLINQKYLGDEPIFADSQEVNLGKAFNWYSAMCSNGDAKEFMVTYLKNVGRFDEAKQFDSVPDGWTPRTACWIARLTSRGVKVDAKVWEFFEDSLTKALTHSTVVRVQGAEKAPVVSIQKRITDRANEIIGDIEQMIDEGKIGSIYDWLKSRELPALYSPMIVAYYTPILNELLDALSGSDPQLKEAFGKMPKKKLEAKIFMYNSIIEEAARYGQVVKKSRVPRKPRKVSVEKKLKGLKYQKEDATYKIASVNPEKVIGCQELWTFNTKYKTLTVFRASGRGGLQFKGTSIIGFDATTSVTKRTGRKPEYFIDRVMNGGKIVLRKLMEEIKGDVNLANRINENTILLKVV
jgi:hypothetical protein